VIGTNKQCAAETVRALIEDHRAGQLPDPSTDGDHFTRLLGGQAVVDSAGWRAIDAHERAAGTTLDRPRVKLTTTSGLLDVALGEGLRDQRIV
jgi:ferredoxin--NADP+ reductase